MLPVFDEWRKEFVASASSQKVPWSGTAEDFYIFVRFMYASHRDGSIAFDMCDPFYAKERKELEQFGVAFAQVFDVDLSPYESFSEMIDEVDYAERMQDICVKGLNFLQGEIALAEAVEGEEGIEYNNEMDVDDIAEDISHEILMTRMQRFFKFKDEESN